MKKTWTLLLFYLTHLFGCGPSASSSKLSEGQVLELKKLREYLKELYSRKAQEHLGNWPSDQDCDGALWAGVARAAGLEQVQVHLGLTEEGRPTRRPLGDCGPLSHGFNNGAAGTTSTDMQLGLILGLFAAKDLAHLEHMRNYADLHNLLVGVPKELLSRSVMKPGTRALLGQAIWKLGGKKDKWALMDQVYFPPLTDYQLHLELLTLHLEFRLGTWNRTKLAVARMEADLNPGDSLAQAVAGKKKEAASLLLNPNWVPPEYVRGPELASLVHKLLILHILLDTSP